MCQILNIDEDKILDREKDQRTALISFRERLFQRDRSVWNI